VLEYPEPQKPRLIVHDMIQLYVLNDFLCLGTSRMQEPIQRASAVENKLRVRV